MFSELGWWCCEFTWLGDVDHFYFEFVVRSFIVNNPSFALFWYLERWSAHFGGPLRIVEAI